MEKAREIGISHSSPTTAFFNLDASEFYSFLEVEGAQNLSADEIEMEIRGAKELHEKRRFAVFVAGSPAFIESYRSLRGIDWLVACGDEISLTQLGIPVFDKGWSRGDPPLSLNEHLLRS